MGTPPPVPYRVPVWLRVGGGVDANPRVRVVAAAPSEGLARLLGHLLLEADDLESFVGVPSPEVLAREISRLSPDVIVVALASLGSEPAARLAELKRAKPAPRLLVIASSLRGEEKSPLDGADAQISEDAVVARLVSEIRRLART